MKQKKRHKLIFRVILIIQLFFFQLTLAQPGSLDLSFNTNDIGFLSGDGANGIIYSTSIQSDGKIIIGGEFSTYNGTARNRIARLNVNGTVDETFNPGSGTEFIIVGSSSIRTTCIQSDGKIIIGGAFTSYNGIARNYIARLNSDGTLDNTFNPGTGASGNVRTCCIQPDGKIIIGGSFSTFNGVTVNRIIRLNSDGTIDNSFNIGTGASGIVRTTQIQNDGKIIIGGAFTSYNGISRNYIARLNSDGTLDNTFNPGTGPSSPVNDVFIQNDGKVTVAGDFTSYNGTGRNYILRLNANGGIDTSFNPGTGPNGLNNSVQSTSVQNDGKIVVAGNFTTFNGTACNYISRLNTDGTIDSTFNAGSGALDVVYNTAIQSDGKLIIAGNFTSYNGTGRNRIVRLNTNGTLDLSFNPRTASDGIVYATSIQNDGKIIVGGDFNSFDEVAIKKIARLNSDGTLDNTFNPVTGINGLNNEVRSISIQTDGKIIMGGGFFGTNKNFIARLDSNGVLDNTFTTGTGADNRVMSTSIQSNGKIIIGGQFISYNGTSRNRIARLNSNGTLDTTFNPGTGANDIIWTTSIQPDGKIIIGGDFTSYNGVAINRIARLNTDGSLDSSFNPGTGANATVFTTEIQSDWKILIGGNFQSYNGTSRYYIARLNLDGSLEPFINGTTGPNGTVSTISIQSDGRIIIGGPFTSYNGNSRNRLARLNVNGSLDSTFNPGTGADGGINNTAIQSDGKIIIGGSFTSYNGTGRNRIARVNDSEILSNSIFENINVVTYPNPNNGKFTIQIDDFNFGSRLEIYDLLGQKIFSNEITSIETVVDFTNNNGVYIYKLFNRNDVIKTGKIIVE